MDPHFRAFSFVDRITSGQAGPRITGRYEVPGHLAAFPNSLVSEAVGQLAAWAAMASCDFSHRPVAGIAGRVEMHGAVRPGQTLNLAADIESIDNDAVAYAGQASVDGRPVVQLEHCVGPMMPLSDFDEPQKVRERFEMLSREGAVVGAFAGLPALVLDSATMTSDDSMSARILVPRQAEFFADHFPRRPVFPGTLLTHLALQLAVALMDSISPAPAGSVWTPRLILDVKLRSFTQPGKTIELAARQSEVTRDTWMVALQIRSEGKRIGSCRVSLALEAVE